MLLELQRGQGTGAFATPRKTSWLLRQLAGGETAGEAAAKVIDTEVGERAEREAFRIEACAAAGLSPLSPADGATSPRGLLKKVAE